MGSFIDISGNKYGRLLVISLDSMRGKQGAYWKCECDCGNIKVIWGASLKNGSTLSCGCYNAEKTAERSRNNFKDISGERFGKLIVLERIISTDGVSRWKCVCDCGKETIVRAGCLQGGNTKSCGCYMLERIRESNFEDLKSQRFGKLTVLYEDKTENKHEKEKRVRWICLCDCGKTSSVTAKNLKNGTTKSCGCLHESYLASELKGYFIKNYNAEKEHRTLKNQDTNQWFRCDIYIPYGENPNINGFYIEIHGEQHYKLNDWHKHQSKKNGTTPEEEFEKQKKKDKVKKNFAKRNGVYIEIDVRKFEISEDAIFYIEKILEKNLFYE